MGAFGAWRHLPRPGGEQEHGQSAFRCRHFLQKPGWPTPVFWLLLAGGIAVAIYAFVASPGQRSFQNVRNLVFRMSIGAMWWQATL